jgi:hypothetical protein
MMGAGGAECFEVTFHFTFHREWILTVKIFDTLDVEEDGLGPSGLMGPYIFSAQDLRSLPERAPAVPSQHRVSKLGVICPE